MRSLLAMILVVAIGLGLFLGLSPRLYAQGTRAVINTTRDGIAIKGYDPVAYHTLSQPVRGTATFNYEWMGATWLFSSIQHRDLFIQDPERYAPQFGGYCSWAVSRGSLADIDPDAWHIENGRLYLNLNPRINRSFVSNVQENIRRAEVNWPGLRNRLSND
jgi:YHS domain-containing protein